MITLLLVSFLALDRARAALSAHAHERAHGDPEHLGHWRALVHLLFQWAHLVAFGLWVGVMVAATRIPALSLERLLFATWGLLLVSLGTGSYISGTMPDAPDVLSLPRLRGRWEFGDAYVVLIGAKQALLALAALWTTRSCSPMSPSPPSSRTRAWTTRCDAPTLRGAPASTSAGLLQQLRDQPPGGIAPPVPWRRPAPGPGNATIRRRPAGPVRGKATMETAETTRALLPDVWPARHGRSP